VGKRKSFADPKEKEGKSGEEKKNYRWGSKPQKGFDVFVGGGKRKKGAAGRVRRRGKPPGSLVEGVPARKAREPRTHADHQETILKRKRAGHRKGGAEHGGKFFFAQEGSNKSQALGGLSGRNFEG